MENYLKARSTLKGVGRAKGFVQEYCREHAIPAAFAEQYCVALDEFLANIVPICTSSRIHIGIEKKILGQCEVLEATIMHDGPGYDISDQNHIVWPTETTNTKFSEMAGFVIHKCMDTISCNRTGDVNTVVFTKRI